MRGTDGDFTWRHAALFLGDLLWVPKGQAFWAREQLSAAGRRSSASLKILQGILATKMWRNRWKAAKQCNQGKAQNMWRLKKK